MMDGSERQSHGEDHVVYGRVEFSRRDLDAGADSESDAAVQRNSPDNQSGCQEHLLVASVLSVLKKRGIHFDFWPQPAERLILKGVVPRIGSSDLMLVAGWQRNADYALQVEMPECLSIRERWRHDRMCLTVGAGTGGKTHVHECGQHGVAAFF